MNFKDWILKEMPLNKADRIGPGWGDTKNNHWWDTTSLKLLQSEKALKKIRLAWEKTDYDFDLYFYKGKGMRDTLETGKVNLDFVHSKLNLPEFKNDEDAITVIYTNNRGADRVPMTAWTIAHRFSHALRVNRSGYNNSLSDWEYFSRTVLRDFGNLAKEIFNFEAEISYGYPSSTNSERYLRELMAGIGTMKSAREGKLNNVGEFNHELVAQYLLTGRIKFNRNFPRTLGRKKAWGRPNPDRYSQIQDAEKIEDIQDEIERMEDTYSYMIDGLLGGSIGSIFVI